MDEWQVMERQGVDVLVKYVDTKPVDRARLIDALVLVASGKQRAKAHLSLEAISDKELQAMVRALLVNYSYDD